MKKFFEISWIFIILFFILSLLDYRFGILALICMMTPIFFALKGDANSFVREVFFFQNYLLSL